MATYTTAEYVEAIKAAEAAGDMNGARALTQAMADSMRAETRGPMATAMHGATLGISSALSPEAREQVESYREREPGAALGMEMLGGLGAGAGIGTGVALAGRARGPVGAAGRWLSQPRVLPQATLGGAEAATLGAMEAQPGERGMGAAMSAVPGAVLGGASPAVSGYLTRRFAPNRPAEQALERSMKRDLGRRPTQADYTGFEELSRRRPELTLAEMPGAVTQGLARTMTATPAGGGAQRARQVLEPRAEAASERMVRELRELTGAEGEYYQNLERLSQQRARDASVLYDAAYEAPFEPGENEMIMDIMDRARKTSWFRSAYREAEDLAAAEGRSMPPWSEFSKEPEVAGVLSLEEFDWLKRGLDAKYESMVKDSPSKARSLWMNIREPLVNELDLAVPEYSAARAAYAGPSRQMKAQEMGKNILREDAGLTELMLREMSDAEKEAYVLAATEAIATRLRSKPRGRGGAPSIPQYVEDRIRHAFPDDASFEQFKEMIDAEIGMQGFKTALLSRSPTADIQTQQEDLQTAGGMAGAVGTALRGDFTDAVRQALAVIRPPRGATLSENIADPLTDMLFSQGSAIPGVLQKLQRPAVRPSLIGPMTTTQAAILANEARRRLTEGR